MFTVIRKNLFKPVAIQFLCRTSNIVFESTLAVDFSRRGYYESGGRKSAVYHYACIRRGLADKPLPSHVIIKMPALSPTMEMGNIVEWSKKEGDTVTEGDLLVEVETDKATMGVESDDTGFLAKILMPAGSTDVKIGTPICVIVDNAQSVAAFKDFKADAAAASAPAAASPPKPTSPPPPPPKMEEPMKRMGPKGKRESAKKEAAEQPKGPKIEEKKDKAEPKPDAKHVFTDTPLSAVRKVIATRLLQSKQEIPHFYLTREVDTDALNDVRKIMNTELASSGVKISVNDMVVKATALASKNVPAANSAWMGEFIREFSSVDVCVAVSTPTGLITPIVFDANSKLIREISTEIKDLAKRARVGKLKPKEFQGGTITVSNLGMLNIRNFMAIINPPQSCILAVGAGFDRLFIGDSKMSTIAMKKVMSVTLSCDHRVVDGAVGAQWLDAFAGFIEKPDTMF